MAPLSIAVIGSGISGLSAAWLLSHAHDVTIYEADKRSGGHSNTVMAPTSEGEVAVDTGFIVYNETSYPNLTALLNHLGVASHPTAMSFAVTGGNGAYEYSGSGLKGFFGQPGNLIRPSHWRMLKDVLRFFKTAPFHLETLDVNISLGAFLKGQGYSQSFISDHILPMGAAIWSTPADVTLEFPARSFISFYENHGLLKLFNRPHWSTVKGGSRQYIDAMERRGNFRILTNAGAAKVTRGADGVSVVLEDGERFHHDHVVMASHADQSLTLIDDPDAQEQQTLSAFRYEKNAAFLHKDSAWMPKRKNLWSAWNYISDTSGPRQKVSVSYWMNTLQNLETRDNLFLTLNPHRAIAESQVIYRTEYAHPIFDARAVTAQRSLWSLQGRRRTWYCGSYFGYGFHEDGLQSGLAVAEKLGGVKRPWKVANESGRIHLAPTEKSHNWMEAAE